MSMMLDAILRMPPDCWDGGVLDVMQRHGRYVEAADRIEALEAALREIGYGKEPNVPGPDIHQCVRIARLALEPQQPETEVSP